jgi:hypothetical protein
MAVIAPKASAPRLEPRRHAESETANAAEVIIAITPVAYAPACASTLA